MRGLARDPSATRLEARSRRRSKLGSLLPWLRPPEGGKDPGFRRERGKRSVVPDEMISASDFFLKRHLRGDHLFGSGEAQRRTPHQALPLHAWGAGDNNDPI